MNQGWILIMAMCTLKISEQLRFHFFVSHILNKASYACNLATSLNQNADALNMSNTNHIKHTVNEN